MSAPDCTLCEGEGETVLWQGERCRVILADEPGFPGFCRVVWQAHVAEMTDLAPIERAHVMDVVYAVEAALRAAMRPAKVNLAALGNMVPHMHWHVVPRFEDDPSWPGSPWSPAQRDGAQRSVDAAALRATLAGKLGREPAPDATAPSPDQA